MCETLSQRQGKLHCCNAVKAVESVRDREQQKVPMLVVLGVCTMTNTCAALSAHAAPVNVNAHVHVHITKLLCTAPQAVRVWRCGCQIAPMTPTLHLLFASCITLVPSHGVQHIQS